MRSPCVSALPCHQTVEAQALVAFRNFHIRPFEKGGGQIKVEHRFISHLTTSLLGNPGIIDHHGNPERLLVMRPFASKPPVPHMKTVICGVNDNRILGQALILESV